MEVFYINLIGARSSRKASFVLIKSVKDHLEIFQKSSCISLIVRVFYRDVTFQRGSVSMLLQQNLTCLKRTPYNHQFQQ